MRILSRQTENELVGLARAGAPAVAILKEVAVVLGEPGAASRMAAVLPESPPSRPEDQEPPSKADLRDPLRFPEMTESEAAELAGLRERALHGELSRFTPGEKLRFMTLATKKDRARSTKLRLPAYGGEAA